MRTTDEVLRTMRAMAWERAKGELRSTLHTYWGNDEGFVEMAKKVDAFIKDVEGEGLVG